MEVDIDQVQFFQLSRLIKNAKKYFSPGQNQHRRHFTKLSAKTHFAKLTRILFLIKARECYFCKSLFLLFPTPQAMLIVNNEKTGMHNVNTAPRGIACVTDALNLLQWRIQGRGPERLAPLIFRPDRAPKGRKNWAGGPAPSLPYLRVRMTGFPSFSESLYPPLLCIEWAIQMV